MKYSKKQKLKKTKKSLKLKTNRKKLKGGDLQMLSMRLNEAKRRLEEVTIWKDKLGGDMGPCKYCLGSVPCVCGHGKGVSELCESYGDFICDVNEQQCNYKCSGALAYKKAKEEYKELYKRYHDEKKKQKQQNILRRTKRSKMIGKQVARSILNPKKLRRSKGIRGFYSNSLNGFFK